MLYSAAFMRMTYLTVLFYANTKTLRQRWNANVVFFFCILSFYSDSIRNCKPKILYLKIEAFRRLDRIKYGNHEHGFNYKFTKFDSPNEEKR